MAKAKVYNKHSHGLTHREKFKEQMIVIEAGEYIEMDYEEAVEFKSQYFPMKLGPDEVQLPESYKMIQIVPIDDPTAIKAEAFKCQLTGKSFGSAAELDKHLEQFKALIAPIDEEGEKEVKRRKGNAA
jgi:hypothetical protein